jgi:hypothetical protein
MRVKAKQGQMFRWLRAPLAPVAIAVLTWGVVTSASATAHAASRATSVSAVPADASPSPQVAVRPPALAWSSWNSFSSQIDEQVIKDEADAMVSTGLKDAGYQYVNIDEGWWEGQRDADGNIVPRAGRWPDGMNAVVDYIHSKGLKAGIYTDVGRSGCGSAGYDSSHSGSEGHYLQDFEQFERWGFDYVKVDWCGGNAEGLDPQATYTKVSKALAAATAVTGHPMLLSICEWGVDNPSDWGAGLGISWRTGGDIMVPFSQATFGNIMASFDSGVHPAGEHTGYYNDLDMMTVGMAGMRPQDDQTLMSLWSVMGSPLIEGADLTKVSPQAVTALTNREVLAVDQDPRGLPGVLVQNQNGLQVYEKVLAGSGNRAVVLLNRSSATAEMSVSLSELGLAGQANVRDVWAGKDLAPVTGSLEQQVPAQSVKMFVLHGHDAPTPRPFGAPTTSGSAVHFSGHASSLGLKRVDISYLNSGSRPRAASMTTDGTATTVLLPPTGAGDGSVSAIVYMHPGTNSVDFAGTDPALPYGDSSAPDVRAVHVSDVGPQTLVPPSSVQSPYMTTASAPFAWAGQSGPSKFTIAANGRDIWQASGADQYAAIYRRGAARDGTTAIVKVDSLTDTNEWTRAGLVFRNDLTKAGRSGGYVVLAVTPNHGVTMLWDADGNGYLETSGPGAVGVTAPAWLKLARQGTAFTGWYSTDGTTWNAVGSANLPSATTSQDVGMLVNGHAPEVAVGTFTDFSATTP